MAPRHGNTIRFPGTVALTFTLCMIGPTSGVAPENPEPTTVLRVGMSSALTGPAGDLGTGMKVGIEAAFAEYNRRPESRGRRFELIAMDDGYEPSRTAPNVRKLIGEDHVVALLGNVGTPTGVVAIPIATEAKVPFIGAFTGAAVLRPNPPNRYVINYRASYAEECAAMVDALVNHAGLNVEQIALFTQRDAYGDDGYNSAIAAMKRHGLKDEARILHGRYERNTVAVEGAVADVLSAAEPPKAIIMVGTAIPCAKFVHLAREYGVRCRFLSVSFVGTTKFVHELGANGDGVIVTQVVPHFDADLPVVRAFHAALPPEASDMHRDFCALEGYIAARVFLHAVDRISGPVTGESIVNSIESLGKFDIGLNETLELSPTRHQACSRVWPTVIRNGKVHPMAWEQLATDP